MECIIPFTLLSVEEKYKLNNIPKLNTFFKIFSMLFKFIFLPQEQSE